MPYSSKVYNDGIEISNLADNGWNHKSKYQQI